MTITRKDKVNEDNSEYVTLTATLVFLKKTHPPFESEEGFFYTRHPILHISALHKRYSLLKDITKALNDWIKMKNIRGQHVENKLYVMKDAMSIWHDRAPYFYNTNCEAVYLVRFRFPRKFVKEYNHPEEIFEYNSCREIKISNQDSKYATLYELCDLPEDIVIESSQILDPIFPVYNLNYVTYFSKQGKQSPQENLENNKPNLNEVAIFLDDNKTLHLHYGTGDQVKLDYESIKKNLPNIRIDDMFNYYLENKHCIEKHHPNGIVPLYGRTTMQHFGGDFTFKLIRKILMLAFAAKENAALAAKENAPSAENEYGIITSINWDSVRNPRIGGPVIEYQYLGFGYHFCNVYPHEDRRMFTVAITLMRGIYEDGSNLNMLVSCPEVLSYVYHLFYLLTVIKQNNQSFDNKQNKPVPETAVLFFNNTLDYCYRKQREKELSSLIKATQQCMYSFTQNRSGSLRLYTDSYSPEFNLAKKLETALKGEPVIFTSDDMELFLKLRDQGPPKLYKIFIEAGDKKFLDHCKREDEPTQTISSSTPTPQLLLYSEMQNIVKEEGIGVGKAVLELILQRKYQSALWTICKNENEDGLSLLQCLLKYKDAIGLDLNARSTSNNFSAIEYADKHDDKSMFKLLLEYGALEYSATLTTTTTLSYGGKR